MGNSTLLSLATLILAAGLAGWFTRSPQTLQIVAAEPVLQTVVSQPDTSLTLEAATPSLAKGSLVIAGGGTLPSLILQRFLDLGGGKDANLVIIPTASSIADSPDVLGRMPIWRELHPGTITVLHAETREASCEVDFSRPLETATAVWFVGGDQNYITERYLGTPVEAALHQVLARGGVIGGTSAGAAIMSRVMIAGGRTTPQLATGLGFLSGTIVDQHFIKRNRKDRLHAALKEHPGLVGVGIDEETALVCGPSGFEVIGNSSVLMCLSATTYREGLTQTINTGEKFDLHPWTVAAADRVRSSKSESRSVPNLQKGAVVIAGHRPPKAAVQEFLALAGGRDANVVLVSESSEAAENEKRIRDFFEEMGAANVTVCAAADEGTMHDPKVTERFAQAQGVWFVGAEEERLLDLDLRAPLQKVVNEILARGGAVGGCSAGARMQGDCLVRRKVATSTTLPADSLSTGLGVLAGMVIDECSAGDETTDTMATMMRDRFPNLIGLGLNESAAVVVRGHRMQVVGSESVSVYDSAASATDSTTTDQKIPAGQVYDFVARRVVETLEQPTTR
ncbi:MAG TPA: cyanophycinase [Planctomycetaceae bacterium]|nr:cyanophycinase [Planctomycetaceae bacterium]